MLYQCKLESLCDNNKIRSLCQVVLPVNNSEESLWLCLYCSSSTADSTGCVLTLGFRQHAVDSIDVFIVGLAAMQ